MHLYRLAWLSGWLLASVATSHAQDLTVLAPRWKDLSDPPQTLPALQGKLDLPLPDALKTATEPAYASTVVLLDAEGKVLSATSRGTHPALVQALDVAKGAWKFSPAKRGRQSVPAEVVMGVVFNPATAAPNGPDAAPRLLSADLLWLPAPYRKDDGRSLQVDVALDASGRVTAVKNAPADLEPETSTALKTWKFAPARQAGKPVAGDLRVTVAVVTAAPLYVRGGPQEARPRPEGGRNLDYPDALRAANVTGQVIVRVDVDLEGRARNPVVFRSTHPGFEDAALDAARSRTWDPVLQNGLPVYSQVSVPLVFGYRMPPVAQKVPANVDQSQWPEELRHDTMSVLHGTQQAVYPFALLSSGTAGRAVAQVLISERGRVIQATLREASAPEFGQALLAALNHYSYSPALNGRKVVKSIRTVVQDFGPDEKLLLVTKADLELLERAKQQPQTIVSIAELDAPLVPTSQREPVFPFAMVGKTDRGEAVVEFIVDEKGRARLPRIVSASDPAFGYMAAQDVASWRFEPPKKGKRATAVRVQLPLRFIAPAEENK